MFDDEDASDSESSNVSGPNVRTRPSDFNLRRRHERTDPDPDARDDSDLEQDPISDDPESDEDEVQDLSHHIPSHHHRGLTSSMRTPVPCANKIADLRSSCAATAAPECVIWIV